MPHTRVSNVLHPHEPGRRTRREMQTVKEALLNLVPIGRENAVSGERLYKSLKRSVYIGSKATFWNKLKELEKEGRVKSEKIKHTRSLWWRSKTFREENHIWVPIRLSTQDRKELLEHLSDMTVFIDGHPSSKSSLDELLHPKSTIMFSNVPLEDLGKRFEEAYLKFEDPEDLVYRLEDAWEEYLKTTNTFSPSDRRAIEFYKNNVGRYVDLKGRKQAYGVCSREEESEVKQEVQEIQRDGEHPKLPLTKEDSRELLRLETKIDKVRHIYKRYQDTLNLNRPRLATLTITEEMCLALLRKPFKIELEEGRQKLVERIGEMSTEHLRFYKKELEKAISTDDYLPYAPLAFKLSPDWTIRQLKEFFQMQLDAIEHRLRQFRD